MIATKSNKLNNPLINALVALLYIVEYHYAYTKYVIPVWGYMNLTYCEISNFATCLLYFISLIPIFFYKGFRFVSSAFSIFTYIFVYIPFMETVFSADLPNEIRYSYGSAFFCMMILFFKTDNLSFGKGLLKKFNNNYSFKTLLYLYVILIILCLLANLNHIRFVNIFSQANLMYELRAELHENQQGVLSYILLWLSHAFLPILLVYLYVKNSRIGLLLILASSLLLFMMDMQKSTFLFPLVLMFFLFINSKYPIRIVKYFNIFIMAIMMSVSYLCCVTYDKSPTMSAISMMIVYRTQCVAGAQLDRYLNFFEVEGNPYTYYSHIRIVNAITNSYPYGDKSIGQAVAGDEGNSNATFLLMDGVAAWGIVGVIISGILFVIFKSFLNSMMSIYERRYVIIIMLFGIISFLNVSLFTSILSKGFLIIYILLLIFNLPYIEKKSYVPIK